MRFPALLADLVPEVDQIDAQLDQFDTHFLEILADLADSVPFSGGARYQRHDVLEVAFEVRPMFASKLRRMKELEAEVSYQSGFTCRIAFSTNL